MWIAVFLIRVLLQFEPQPSRIPVALPRPATAPPQEKRFPLSLFLLLPFIYFLFGAMVCNVTGQRCDFARIPLSLMRQSILGNSGVKQLWPGGTR
jgi:hypothetical protein